MVIIAQVTALAACVCARAAANHISNYRLQRVRGTLAVCTARPREPAEYEPPGQLLPPCAEQCYTPPNNLVPPAECDHNSRNDCNDCRHCFFRDPRRDKRGHYLFKPNAACGGILRVVPRRGIYFLSEPERLQLEEQQASGGAALGGVRG